MNGKNQRQKPDHRSRRVGAPTAAAAPDGGTVVGAGATILKDTKDFEVYRASATKPSRVPSTRLRFR